MPQSRLTDFLVLSDRSRITKTRVSDIFSRDDDESAEIVGVRGWSTSSSGSNDDQSVGRWTGGSWGSRVRQDLCAADISSVL